VHHRNIHPEAPVTMHIGSGADAVIVEGRSREDHLTPGGAVRLAEASFAKYPQYGRRDPSVYAAGVLVLRPTRVLAWTRVGLDATRFRFPR
jgi:hypothetical protein